ncbi:TauD/TfdA family dioxygenase [Jannaschia sp.]|nr:TauD/TfdA family dioxygenase [Jannaschia sp.]
MQPSYQAQHCLANEAQGRGALFADGVAMAEALRAEAPAAVDQRTTGPIPFRFHDSETDIRVHRSVIALDAQARSSDRAERLISRTSSI